MTTATIMGTETKESVEMITNPYGDLITEDIDFRVETRSLRTKDDKDVETIMPYHQATFRINPDGTEAPLWVVGSRYEIVDHREMITGFAEALDKAEITAEVEHKVYANGCRIYSFFTVENEYSISTESGKKARPFFTLTTSHDGSLKLGFMVGARVGSRTYNVSKTVYGAYAKHTKGINIEKTLKEIEKALNSFVSEVLPMWGRMQGTAISTDQAKKILENAVKRNVVSQRRADKVDLSDCKTVWDAYDAIIGEVSEITTVRGTEERVFDRNTKVGEYFRKLAVDKDMSGLKSLLS